MLSGVTFYHWILFSHSKAPDANIANPVCLWKTRFLFLIFSLIFTGWRGLSLIKQNWHVFTVQVNFKLSFFTESFCCRFFTKALESIADNVSGQHLFCSNLRSNKNWYLLRHGMVMPCRISHCNSLWGEENETKWSLVISELQTKKTVIR